ncbi:2-hydroxyacid dehydrogenase [Occallatibacter savannae]|uniref:2-hydroxyacid dehydrogenase n=1 Tax=Occallatibacter savannae TaxID=1002691 RepID=UPI000D69365F|nr:2-hydroxyacid dehydrogenase [Occallatibacter savannae]
MVRVGYSANLAPELLKDFPEGVELIALPRDLDHDIDIEVWLPDPYPTRNTNIYPRLRGLKLVLSLMAGTEWIPAAVGPHVTICNARGAHNISTAEWTVSATLAMLKHFPLFLDVQRSGEWKRRFEATTEYERVSGDARQHYPPVMLEELTGKRVLLVGYGSIGKEIERMLEPFRVELTRVARRARENPKVHAVRELDALIPQAQVIMLILPSTAESRGLIGARQFALMEQGTLLVNAARGPVVDTDALAAALNSGKIRAALDVTEPEPLPEGHPLWKCPNLLITPHVGGSSPEFARRALKVAELELRRYMAGEPLLNVVQSAV